MEKQPPGSHSSPGLKWRFELVVAAIPLSAKDRSDYRASAARANYLVQDRPDIMFAAKEVCRWMSVPTVGAWKSLKRLGHYGTP